MALQKTFERPDGCSGDYWKIVSVTFGIPNLDLGTIDIEARLSLYRTKADSQAGKSAMGETRTVIIPVSLSTISSVVYNKAKTTLTSTQGGGDTPFFSDAIDI